MKIYTRGGDAGETGLFGGGRIGKEHERIEALGAVDELNAALGWANAQLARDLRKERGPTAAVARHMHDGMAELAVARAAHAAPQHMGHELHAVANT